LRGARGGRKEEKKGRKGRKGRERKKKKLLADSRYSGMVAFHWGDQRESEGDTLEPR
jgi:hypothetical protein